MNHFYRRRTANGSQGNEVEALQTDVMRFIAILGICLMVIFALVQSLPVSSQGKQPRVYNKEILQRQVDDLSRQLAAQQKKLQSVVKAIKERKKELADYKKELLLAQNEYMRARSQLDAAENELQVEQSKIKGVVRNVDKAREYAKSLKIVLDDLRQKVTDQKVKKSKTPSAYRKPSRARSSREGFALHFASESALEHLVGNNRVWFFMLSGGKSWRLAGHSGSTWRFFSVKRTEMPKQVYQLIGKDVPEGFVSAGKKVVADFSGPEYYVWLPSDIRTNISRIMEERTNGEIEIDQLGKVSVQ